MACRPFSNWMVIVEPASSALPLMAVGGHGIISVVANQAPAEMAQMEAHVAQAMEDGALGLSTSLLNQAIEERVNAQILADRFKPAMGLIDSWDTLEEPNGVCIDNMMNLELLLSAHAQGGGEHFREVAVAHAQTTLQQFVRADGSTYHIVRHEEDGSIERRSTHVRPGGSRRPEPLDPARREAARRRLERRRAARA